MSAERPAIVSGYNDQVRFDVLPSVPEAAGKVLDVGGGTGATAAYLKRCGRATRAGTVDLARGDTAHEELDFQHFGDLDDTDFVERVLREEGPFDTILCLDILEHLVDPWQLVARLHDALTPGGVIVASLPNVRHYRVSGALLFRNRWRLQDAGILDRTHLRFFVRSTMIELLTHSGLTLEQIRAPLPARRRRAVALFRKLTRGKLDSLISVRYILRVRRPAS